MGKAGPGWGEIANAAVVVGALLACGGSRSSNTDCSKAEQSATTEEQSRLAAQNEATDLRAKLSKADEQRNNALREAYAILTPGQRTALLKKCARGTCEGSEELLLSTTRSNAERAGMQRFVEQQRAALDRAAAATAARSVPVARAPRGGASTVLCCDGTRSPTCGCDRSSFRGCCSHHGGICGGCD